MFGGLAKCQEMRRLAYNLSQFRCSCLQIVKMPSLAVWQSAVFAKCHKISVSVCELSQFRCFRLRIVILHIYVIMQFTNCHSVYLCNSQNSIPSISQFAEFLSVCLRVSQNSILYIYAFTEFHSANSPVCQNLCSFFAQFPSLLAILHFALQSTLQYKVKCWFLGAAWRSC